MRFAPVAVMIPPAVLPVFDPSWKAECKSCAHVWDGGQSGIRCRAVPMSWNAKHHAGKMGMFCIDAREDGAVCGPDAALRVAA